MSETSVPIFIIGRQHCGNTMLATMLGQHPQVYASTGEGAFFERIDSINGEATKQRRQRVVREIAHGSHPVLGEDLQRTLRTHLRKETQHRQAADLYAEGKAVLTERNGAVRWAQKATSYVFYVERILEAFANARLIFLVRNPLDLAASVQRRGEFWNIARMLWGWNVGVRRALQWENKCPANVQIHRYEDLVRHPEKELRAIKGFCKLEYSPDCLEIPHINPSEDPYTETGEASGPNASRVFYYPDVLTPTNEMAVRTLASQELLEEFYPDLPSPRDAYDWRGWQRAGILVGGSIVQAARQHAGTVFQNPGRTVRRLKNRLLDV